jgi:hypothetical protein
LTGKRKPEWDNRPLAKAASLPVRVILRTVWDDLGELLVRLRSQSVIALSLLIVFEIIGTVPEISGNPLLSEAFNLMSTIATLPFEIAIFGLLILNEAASGYHFALSTVRFQRMLGWTAALWALVTVPSYLASAIAPSGGAAAVISLVMIVVFTAVMVRLSILLPAIAVDAPGASIVVFTAVMVRLSILLPAIAVDAPGASAGNAVADTQGHAWLILKAYFTILLPFILIIVSAAVLASLSGFADIVSNSGAVASGALFGAMGFFVVCTAMIVPARLFMSLGDRLKGAAPVTTAAQPDP